MTTRANTIFIEVPDSALLAGSSRSTFLASIHTCLAGSIGVEIITLSTDLAEGERGAVETATDRGTVELESRGKQSNNQN